MQKWVLTQDKESLVELKDMIYISDHKFKKNGNRYMIMCRYFILGYYSIYEQALEVINNISLFLTKKGTLNDSVFNMPKDIDN